MNSHKEQQQLTRTFLAVDLPKNIKEKIGDIYQNFSKHSIKFTKWIQPENLHLTLKFFGSITDKKINDIIFHIKNLNINLNMDLFIDSYGMFPLKGAPKILWISFKEKKSNKLLQIFKTIEQELKKIEIPEERHPFIPHVTIARLKCWKQKDLEQFKIILEQFKNQFVRISNEHFNIKKLTLFKSKLKPSGAVYSAIEEFE